MTERISKIAKNDWLKKAFFKKFLKSNSSEEHDKVNNISSYSHLTKNTLAIGSIFFPLFLYKVLFLSNRWIYFLLRKFIQWEIVRWVVKTSPFTTPTLPPPDFWNNLLSILDNLKPPPPDKSACSFINLTKKLRKYWRNNL